LCPCRLADGTFEFDRDIICPCHYRDPDVEEFGTCYCALYVRKDVFEGRTPIQPIPERRPLEKQLRTYEQKTVSAETKDGINTTETTVSSGIRLKLWYCKQCGYVVLRENPPYICPICKAKMKMFKEITVITHFQ